MKPADIVLSKGDLDRAVSALLRHEAFAFDVETRSLTDVADDALDFNRAKVTWISLATTGFSCAIPLDHPHGPTEIMPKRKVKETTVDPDTGKTKTRTLAKPPLFSPPPKQLWPVDVFGALRPLFFSDRVKVGHNTKFDMKLVAKYYGGDLPPEPWADTGVHYRMVDENLPAYRLKQLVKRVFKHTYENIGKNVDGYPLYAAANYARQDAKYTWLLYRLLQRVVEQHDLQGVLAIDEACLRPLAKAEQRGVRIDQVQLAELEKVMTHEVETLLGNLYRHRGKEWNPRSRQQIAEFVYTERGNPVKVLTKGGDPSTAKASLEHIAERDDAVADLIAFDEASTHLATFVTGIRTRLNSGRIHGTFNVAQAKTGRMSANNPNLQNIPSRQEISERIRGMYVPSQGHALIVSDYDQIEYRVLAHMANDAAYMEMFETGEDPHTSTASLLFQIEAEAVTKQQRTTAKNVGFGLVYGAGAKKLAAMCGITVDYAQEVLSIHEQTFPDVWRWIAQTNAAAREMRSPYYVTESGRRRRLPDIHAIDPYDRLRAERQGINHVIQGEAAIIMKRAIAAMDRLLDDDMHFLMTVHDEVVVEAPTHKAERCVELVKEAMSGEHIQTYRVRLDADPVIVPSWAQAK